MTGADLVSCISLLGRGSFPGSTQSPQSHLNLPNEAPDELAWSASIPSLKIGRRLARPTQLRLIMVDPHLPRRIADASVNVPLRLSCNNAILQGEAMPTEACYQRTLA